LLVGAVTRTRRVSKGRLGSSHIPQLDALVSSEAEDA
jgi:hypothetical protein